MDKKAQERVFMNQQIIPYVTSNNGKFQEVVHFLAEYSNLPFNLAQDPLETTEVQSDDQKEIAQHKAIEAWNTLKKPLLVEDAGIFFEKFHNFPGTFSKWIFKSLGFAGISKLYSPGDRAYFQITLCYIENPETMHFFQERCYGTLIAPKHGHNPSLPFDTILVPDGFTQTYQELKNTGQKGTFKFRAKAIASFVEWFNKGQK